MSSHNAHSESHEHSAVPYHLTLTALLILTGITVGASYINFGSGSANVTIALAVATVKATLVALIFMHLAQDKPVNGVIALSGFLFLGIFLGFCLLDFNTRIENKPRNMPNMEKATPVPATLNPLLTVPPKPEPKAAAPAEAHE